MPRRSHVSGTVLREDFYERPTLTVACDLLGKYLVRRTGERRLVGRIVEVEAYVGSEDLACHASRGLTPRTSVMFGPPGRAYVYLIYGMYYCLNFVTEREGFPAAVLIRAVEPTEDVEPGVRLDGPGRLTRALEIDSRLNGRRLADEGPNAIWVEDRGEGAPEVATGPRVGVAYAGEWAERPWRFWVANSPFISGSRARR